MSRTELERLLIMIELILKLVEAEGISSDKAIVIAEKIHKTNPRHIGEKVLRDFRNKLAATFNNIP